MSEFGHQTKIPRAIRSLKTGGRVPSKRYCLALDETRRPSAESSAPWAGFLADHLGYNGGFYVFSGVAVIAAIIFPTLMPDTAGAEARTVNPEG